MTIETLRGEMRMVCDTCEDELDQVYDANDESEFREMVKYARAQGWDIRMDRNRVYTHDCSQCSPGPVEAQRQLLRGQR